MKNLEIRTWGKLVTVPVCNVLFFQSQGNKTIINMTNGEKHLVAKTLAKYEDMVADENFYRLHDSWIVNMEQIDFYDSTYKKVILTTKEELSIARRKLSLFLERYKKK